MRLPMRQFGCATLFGSDARQFGNVSFEMARQSRQHQPPHSRAFRAQTMVNSLCAATGSSSRPALFAAAITNSLRHHTSLFESATPSQLTASYVASRPTTPTALKHDVGFRMLPTPASLPGRDELPAAA